MQGRSGEAEKNLQKAHELFPNHPKYKVPAGN
jgi:Flp pilus assembly protein TadD